MREYTVTWEIQLMAASPEDAARQALVIQRDPVSIATHFTVYDEDGEDHVVDLADIEAGR